MPVGRVIVTMIGWHRKSGGVDYATAAATEGWGRFWNDDYEGWPGFFIPQRRRRRSQGMVRVLSGGDYWQRRRAAVDSES
jgi:hypothetical protein